MWTSEPVLGFEGAWPNPWWCTNSPPAAADAAPGHCVCSEFSAWARAAEKLDDSPSAHPGLYRLAATAQFGAALSVQRRFGKHEIRGA